MKLTTINQVVQALYDKGVAEAKHDARGALEGKELYEHIYNEKLDQYKQIANEATIYLKTALICEDRGIDKAMEYLEGTHTADEYAEYLTSVVDPKEG